ncbi:MAG: hypothetical protein ACI9K8_000724 [Reinekea sp.]|jgi:hypothetical protein
MPKTVRLSQWPVLGIVTFLDKEQVMVIFPNTKTFGKPLVTKTQKRFNTDKEKQE